MALYTLTIAVIFLYIFITGFHDEGNLIATIVCSRSIEAKKALIIASVAQFLGPLIVTTAVSTTIAKDIIKYSYLLNSGENISLLILSGILGAALWNFITWYYAIPSSSSHALIGGILGPFAIEYGFHSINFYGIMTKVIIPLFFSPVIGFAAGYIITLIFWKLLKNAQPSVNSFLKKLQYGTMFLLNIGQSANDAQKGMGLIVILMMIKGNTHNFEVPFFIKYIAAFMISFGLLFGGFRMIKSVGGRIYRVRPFHSFNAQLSSLLVVTAATLVGAPISGTQLVNSSILGVGARERPSAVRWQFAKAIFAAWITTIPASFIFSSIIYMVAKLL
ncbi:PiT family inorganic phosphate transporter [Caldanaerobacter subterraneus subsp. tengcongensis MB4]|uniref:Phosphate/sulphate permeases n=1 Tax=Caldanaerobacter subterraneus subsp. tengcongensis (strain DSM 15242 / JCM 11007 / NBRC 100824 / MB4) TaxID=273068 RepID=Q8RCT1_CALS4|nr:inorganic phosphate transporter [Caldanaerobacter subterraneus]AAM23621.1 Phosphate/sulphate permeases [Caldanaerobacter subterraneus subsp. tengcongensis MB4]MCS3916892.1 PiT family inorganic phosphate transporter [Caldanaerobacter subterraneus subsp. tengcongensis MB4]